MPGRSYNAANYAYGFNGKRKDNEMYGEGNAYDFGARIDDPRLSRFLSQDPKARAFPYLTPYAFAANNPIELIDENGEDPVKPFGWLKKAWYKATYQNYLIRVNEYAVKNKIDDSQIFFYNYNNRNFAIIIDVRYDAKTKEEVESKQVFRESNMKAGFGTMPWSNKHDSYNQDVDNYFDDAGKPIPTGDDESNMVVQMGGPGGFGKASTIANGIALAGNASKTWTVYTFLTNLPKAGSYFGMTADFAKRMAQHGARIIGNADRLIENIPDKLTARGVEQLFINFGRKVGVITEQINSINPKRVARYNKGLKQAENFIKKNYGDKFDYLFKK